MLDASRGKRNHDQIGWTCWCEAQQDRAAGRTKIAHGRVKETCQCNVTRSRGGGNQTEQRGSVESVKPFPCAKLDGLCFPVRRSSWVMHEIGSEKVFLCAIRDQRRIGRSRGGSRRRDNTISSWITDFLATRVAHMLENRSPEYSGRPTVRL